MNSKTDFQLKQNNILMRHNSQTWVNQRISQIVGEVTSDTTILNTMCLSQLGFHNLSCLHVSSWYQWATKV